MFCELRRQNGKIRHLYPDPIECAPEGDSSGASYDDISSWGRISDYINRESHARGINPSAWEHESALADSVNYNGMWNGAPLSEWMTAAENAASNAEFVTLGSTTLKYSTVDDRLRQLPFFAQDATLHYLHHRPRGTIQSIATEICQNATAEWNADHPNRVIQGRMLRGLPYPVSSYTALRQAYLGDSSGGGGGRGGGGTTPLPFVAGGPWAETAFRGKTFALEPVLKAGFGPAVRPGTGGYIVDHPHRYATIHVIDIDGTVRFSTTDFALQKVAKQVGEKFQMISTWDGPQLVFRCERGSIYQLGFSMLNTKNFDWLRAFQMNWTRYFRGSALASQQSRLYVLYGATLLGGYPTGMSISESTTAEPLAQLMIQMYITDDVPLPDMTIINAATGEYTWEGDTFVVGSGVSNLDGYVRQATPTPESINEPSPPQIPAVTNPGLV